MKGNTLNDFINDLYHNPEKELFFNNHKYIISGYITPNNNIYTLEVYIISDNDNNTIFSYSSMDREECIKAFKQSKIFDNKTIFEAEQDIEVIIG